MASLEVAILAQKAKQGARDFVAAVRKIRAGGDNVAKGAQKTQTALDSMAAKEGSHRHGHNGRSL